MNLFTSTYLLLFACVSAAPLQHPEDRKSKSLTYFNYIQPDTDLTLNNYDNLDYVSSEEVEENDLSRTSPGKKRLPSALYNSPIYYIRMPPTPYMFVPGLGYVSHPHPPPVQQFLNLPVSFISNGKPSTIYQWGGGLEGFPTAAPPAPPPVRPKPTESSVHRLQGQFAFNGKPNDIFVLRDSYNSLYSDALQNFYP